MDKSWLIELIAFIARETGWSLEYIGNMSYTRLRNLAFELQYQKELDEYKLASCFGMVIATWANAQTRGRRYKVHDFVGGMPRRKLIGGKSFMAKVETVALQLADGKDYQLATLNANMMIEAEETFNLPFFEMFESGKVRMKYVRFLIALMLKENYPELTEQDVGKLLTPQVIAGAFERIIGTAKE